MEKRLFYYIEELQELRTEKSYELFNKPLKDLSDDEIKLLNEYINDIFNPKWQAIYLNGKITNYEISNIGTIRYIYYGKKYIKPIKLPNDPRKYMMIYIGDSVFIHRLVAKAFIPNPENKSEVNHINGNKHCNWYKNLEWCTRQENATHAQKSGLMLKGSCQPCSKHTEADAHAVCKLAEQGLKPKAIMKKLGFSKTFIIGILYRNEWKHISSLYKLPKPKKFNNLDQVHTICQLLEQGKRDFEIAKELNIEWQNVNSIHQGKAWRRISNQYNIPGLEKDNHNDLKLSEKIEKVLKSGITDNYKVLEILNEKNTKHKRDYVMRIKRKLGLIN